MGIKEVRAMTVEQMRESDAVFLRAADIAPIIGCDPQTLRVQARAAPQSLGFPVTLIGQRCKFPRRPFLLFIDGQAERQKEYC